MSNEPRDPEPNNYLVISYLTLRKAVGFLGLLLPLVVALGKILFGSAGLQTSISAYYYTNMGNVLVGSLCAIGVFLMSYRGFDHRDMIAGKLAGLSAITAALFPTSPEDVLMGTWTSPIHFAAAVLLFLTLAYFSLCLFRKTDPSKPPTPQKLKRNKVYAVCGYLILASIAGAGISFALRKYPFFDLYKPVFWCESVAVVSFGVSWLTKGEAILKDE
jgi:hypothetical protein